MESEKGEKDQELAATFVAMCDPDSYHDNLRDLLKASKIRRPRIEQIEAELFYLLYLGFDMLLYCLSRQCADEYSNTHDSNISQAGVRIAAIKTLFNTGIEHVAYKRGFEISDENLSRRLAEYGEAFEMLGEGRGAHLKLGEAFCNCCGCNHTEYALLMYATDIFVKTRSTAMELLKENIDLTEE
jgi:hypothetical protein